MEKSGTIHAHIGLRGVAATFVVAYHLQFGSSYHLPFERQVPVFSRSYLFVDLFFILSGFILSYVDRSTAPRRVDLAETLDFLTRRFIRIYPLLFVTTFFLLVERAGYTAIARAMGRTPHADWSLRSLAVLLSQLLLVNAWIPDFEGWNVPTWSISAEFAAYLLFPPVVMACVRWPRAARLLMLVFALVFYVSVAGSSGSLDIIGGWAPARCLAGFFLGMLLHDARMLVARAGAASLGAVQLLAVALIALCLATHVNDCAVIAPFALLVLSTWVDRGIVPRLLSGPFVQNLGEISYSIYLTHVCVISTLIAVWHGDSLDAHIGLAAGRLLWLATCLGATWGISQLTYRYVEKPARSWLTARLLHRRPPPIERSVPAP